MMDWGTHLAFASPIILVALAFVTPLASLLTKRRSFYAAILLLGALVAMLASLRIASLVVERKIVTYFFGGWAPPLGIAYEVDALNAFLGMVLSLAMLVSALHCFWYYRYLVDGWEWMTTLMLLLFAGILGIVYTGDLFNLFVMLEVVCIASYGLVAFFRRRKWAIEAATSYAFAGSLATTIYLLGAFVVYASLGTLAMSDAAAKLSNVATWMSSVSGTPFGNPTVASCVALATMLWALTFEAGLFPNYFWIPSAYAEAPTPASTVFACAVDKAALYACVRLLATVFSVASVINAVTLGNQSLRNLVLLTLALLGVVGGFAGAVAMAMQRDVKKFLAYSTISHVGCMYILFPALTRGTASIALAALCLYVFMHVLGESLLFVALGSLATIVNSRRIEKIVSVARSNRLLGALCLVAMLNMIGLPPLPGFFAKYLSVVALLEANAVPLAIALITISGISAVGYLKLFTSLWPLRRASMQGGGEVSKEHDLLIPTAICLALAIAMIMVGLWLSIPTNLENATKFLGFVGTEEGWRLYIYATKP